MDGYERGGAVAVESGFTHGHRLKSGVGPIDVLCKPFLSQPTICAHIMYTLFVAACVLDVVRSHISACQLLHLARYAISNRPPGGSRTAVPPRVGSK